MGSGSVVWPMGDADGEPFLGETGELSSMMS